MEEKGTVQPSKPTPKSSLRRHFRNAFICLIAVAVCCLHSKYVATLFEKDTNFRLMSDLQREIYLRSEMGFHYYYYKTVVEVKPFFAAISKIMYNKQVEFPKEVNGFNRFNIHPEVILGAAYRYLEPYINTSDHVECKIVSRGEGLSNVSTCNGIGEPMTFYLNAVWALAGVMVAAVFLHAVALSDSIAGGVLAVAQYFGNHSEATRVMWYPNLRENFATPLLFLQCWMVTLQLKKSSGKRTTFFLQISIFILNCLCLLFWQITQFIFMTQLVIFFLMEQLKIIDLKMLCIFVHSHFCGLHLALFLLHGNDMLKTSMYMSVFAVISVYCLCFAHFRIKIVTRKDLLIESLLVCVRFGGLLIAAWYVNKLISGFFQVEEDGHVWDILFSKFTNHKTFHSMLYTFSPPFEFLPSSTLLFSWSLLLPISYFVSLAMCSDWNDKAWSYIRNIRYIRKVKAQKEKDAKAQEEDGKNSVIEATDSAKNKARGDLDVLDKAPKYVTKDPVINIMKHIDVDPAAFYNICQMVVYGVMADLVMRLELLYVTQMCVVISLMTSWRYDKIFCPHRGLKHATWITIGMLLFQAVYVTVEKELSRCEPGQFSDPIQEELITWAASQRSGVFAASMPLLATILLAANKRVVAHPLYENSAARERVYNIYKMYGRFTAEELYEELNKLRATFLVVEDNYCYGTCHPKSRSILDIWDKECPERVNRGGPLCDKLLTNGTTVPHLYPVFRNSKYAVFRVHDLSVRYMPRSFDT